MKIVKWRACGSRQDFGHSPNGEARGSASRQGKWTLSRPARGSRPGSARPSSAPWQAPKPPRSATRRSANRSRNRPADPAVSAKPTIIMIHTSVAAGARRTHRHLLASSTSRLVPAADTRPIIQEGQRRGGCAGGGLRAHPGGGRSSRHATSASKAMPPRIQGAPRPWSRQKPMRGRSSCRRSAAPPANWHQRRQGELDDHHPVQGRGGQHHDRTDAGLHQPRRRQRRTSRTAWRRCSIPAPPPPAG